MLAITFPTRTDEQFFEVLGDAIVSRELEFLHYQLNIDNYEDILRSLPREWPQRLQKLRGMTREDLAAHAPEEDHALAVDLTIADQLAHAVKVERHAQRIVKLVYDALVKRLPEWSRDSVIAAAAERHQRRVASAEKQGSVVNLTVTSEALKIIEMSEGAASRRFEASDVGLLS